MFTRGREREREGERNSSDTAEDHALQRTDEDRRHVSRTQVSFDAINIKKQLTIYTILYCMRTMNKRDKRLCRL